MSALVALELYETPVHHVDLTPAPSRSLTQYVAINTDNFVILPTPRGINLVTAWANKATTAVDGKKTDAVVLNELYGIAHFSCHNPGACYGARLEVGSTAVV